MEQSGTIEFSREDIERWLALPIDELVLETALALQAAGVSEFLAVTNLRSLPRKQLEKMVRKAIERILAQAGGIGGGICTAYCKYKDTRTVAALEALITAFAGSVGQFLGSAIAIATIWIVREALLDKVCKC